MQNMKIIVCSRNKAKNDAVNTVVREYFNNFEIKSLETNNGDSYGYKIGIFNLK